MTTYNVTSRTFRVIPPAGALALVTLPSGRVVDGRNVAYADVPFADANHLGANGWIILMESGPTSARPQAGEANDLRGLKIQMGAGRPYYDTTLSCAVYWNPAKNGWVDETGTSR
jgi:hypothetical protein